MNRRAFLIALGVLIGGRGQVQANAPATLPEPSCLARGTILDFAVMVDGGLPLRVEQRIWNGDKWLPLGSYEGADFFRQIEQEIRDGKVDSE